MNDILPYTFEAETIRVVLVDQEPWWVAADIARVLDYGHTPHMLRTMDADEKGVHKLDTLGGEQHLTIISESGLYAAVLKSRKPEAKRLRRWVTGEVLPSIRRTGRYENGPPPRPPALAGMDSARISACVGLLREARRLFGDTAARALWPQLGLPSHIAQIPADAQDAMLGKLLRYLNGHKAVRSNDAMTAIYGHYSPSNYEKTCALLRAVGWAPERTNNAVRGGAVMWFPPRQMVLQ